MNGIKFSIIVSVILTMVFIILSIWEKDKNDDKVEDFVKSERYNEMSKISYDVAKKYCGWDNIQQLGFDVDQIHVSIICRDKSEIEIRIK